jgi:hypothetical protein
MRTRLPFILAPIGFGFGIFCGFVSSGSERRLGSVEVNPTAIASENGLGVHSSEATRAIPHEPAAEELRTRMAFALAQKSELHRLGEFSRFLDLLAPEQFASVFAEIKGLDGQLESNLLRLFFQRWAALAPETALANALSFGDQAAQYVRAVLFVWARKDLPRAAAEAKKTRGEWSADLREEFRVLSGMRPEVALHELFTRGEPIELKEMQLLFRAWGKEDLRSAWQEAFVLLPDREWEKARLWALVGIIRAADARDATSIGSLIAAIPEETERSNLRGVLIQKLIWSKQIEAAKTYAFALPEGAERRAALEATGLELMFSGLAADPSHVPDLMHFVEEFSAEDRAHLTDLRTFFHRWMSVDPTRASALLLENASSNVAFAKDAARNYGEFAWIWAHTDPSAAIEFALKLPAAVRTDAIRRSLDVWCEKDASSAAAWAESLAPNGERDEILQRVASAWSRHEVTQVTQWLERLGTDSGKSAAIEGFARTIISTRPDDALAWLHAVSDERERLDRLRRVWDQWTDREAAQRWAETSRELTEAERRVLQFVETP